VRGEEERDARSGFGGVVLLERNLNFFRKRLNSFKGKKKKRNDESLKSLAKKKDKKKTKQKRKIRTSTKPGCVAHRSMMLHLMLSFAAGLRCRTRYSSLIEEPVVEQLYCGYCEKAIARFTPSRCI
jgi:hypothetical protein